MSTEKNYLEKVQLQTEELLKVLSLCKTSGSLSNFILDITTPQELEELALRWQIVKALDEGINQRAIARNLNCSVTTVSRGSRALKYGEGGFDPVLQLLRKIKL
jgi:Trp operon repressor